MQTLAWQFRLFFHHSQYEESKTKEALRYSLWLIKYCINKIYEMNLIWEGSGYTVFDAVQSPLCLVPPCKFGKILVIDNFVEKNYFENFRIRNYFKKDFFNFSFHYVRYCNHLVTFLEKISHQFALIFQALNEVSQSNIFLVFFC